jgi:transcriptional regulator with XRE-family HTH domain
MPAETYDLEKIKAVLVEATTSGGKFSQRGLAKEAGEGRDTVGDIINGRNKNPTMKVLTNLATALGGDLSMFGLTEDRALPPTEEELEAALLKALPGMSARSIDARARFLAANLVQILRLPPRQEASQLGQGSPASRANDAPPPTTN